MAKQFLKERPGRFVYEIDTEAKELYVTAIGSYSLEDKIAAFEAFNEIIAQYPPSEYTAVLEFTEVDYTDDSRNDDVIATFKLYLDNGFFRVKMRAPEILSARAQLEDAIEDAGLPVQII